ncbi:DNA alkylation repair protein [Arthrobacter sp. 35W]|uniref:DNA alkylation repair protein n=1 Tax=Arthrobacter sp. 35W TaxID=1132441 RepID=UPI000416F5F1|nr:DNA alkylation repair protein [Arthrobacter sp. 35W]
MLNQPFLDALRPALAAAALPEKAAGMAAYMKSSQPYLGVPMPILRRTVKALVLEHPFSGAGQLLDTAAAVWREASFREERYVASLLADQKLARGDLDFLPLYEQIISTGAWWDHVDGIAGRIWELLEAHPGRMGPLLRNWSVHEDFWFRRSAIIAQLPAKEATDTALLAEVVEPNLGESEFFVRKAIGWSLRQYARTDPAWVLAYVAANRSRLSPLSTREAMKHLG